MGECRQDPEKSSPGRANRRHKGLRQEQKSDQKDWNRESDGKKTIDDGLIETDRGQIL